MKKFLYSKNIHCTVKYINILLNDFTFLTKPAQAPQDDPLKIALKRFLSHKQNEMHSQNIRGFTNCMIYINAKMQYGNTIYKFYGCFQMPDLTSIM